jgi:hypothetical protein
MSRATPAPAPFRGVIYIRDLYQWLYDKFGQQQRKGIAGEMLLASSGVGMRTFGDYVVKRSEPVWQALQNLAAHDTLRWLPAHS